MINRLIGIRSRTNGRNLEELDQVIESMVDVVVNIDARGDMPRVPPRLERVPAHVRRQLFEDEFQALDLALGQDPQPMALSDDEEGHDSDFEDEVEPADLEPAEEDDEVEITGTDFNLCSICLAEDAPLREGEYRMTTCGHKFHPNCIAIAVNFSNRCPLCRCEDPLWLRR